MKATQTLPENHTIAWSLNLKHNMRLNIILQVIGLGWMALAAWLLSVCMWWIRPELKDGLKMGFGGDFLGGLTILVGVMVVVLVLHELAHGLFFWLFSGHRPEFGLGIGYAFAAMPDWYFPKQQYLVIGLAPLGLLTGLGLIASIFAPQTWLGALLAGMVVNAGGAIGDIYVCLRIAFEPPDVWIKDTGDGFQLYRRQDG